MSGFCPNKITVQGQNGPSEISCGTCDACRHGQLTEMVGRCLLEDEAAIQSTMLTLTYAETAEHGATEVIPQGERGYVQFQNMMKRLRKQKHIVRYLCAMEHGTQKTQRMHFHVLLFWINKVPELPVPDAQKQMWKFWPHGYTHHMPVEAKAQAFGYVCKYILKEQTIREKGLPKATGNKRSAIHKDEETPKLQKAARYDMAQAAGFPSYERMVMVAPFGRLKGVWASKNPVFGAGHGSVPDEFRPLASMARQLVKQGLPFTREFKHPNGWYYSGNHVKFVKYFMRNAQLIAEYYRLYCREYYKRHGRGDPPVGNVETQEGKTEREAILGIAYGPKSYVVEDIHPDLEFRDRLVMAAPMATWEERSRKRFTVVFEKVVYYSTSNVALYKRRDGRIIAVRSKEVPAEGYVGAYAKDRGFLPKAKGYMRWPVKDRTELLRLARGTAKDTRQRGARPMKREWRLSDDKTCV